MRPRPHVLVASFLLAGLLAQTGASARPVGDPVRGERVYERCAGCHSLDRNRVGPAHRGVFGRKAGAGVDYRYSRALKDSGIVWDEETLELWLAEPGNFVPGSRMGYRLSNPQDRADVIAFLRQVGEDKRE